MHLTVADSDHVAAIFAAVSAQVQEDGKEYAAGQLQTMVYESTWLVLLDDSGQIVARMAYGTPTLSRTMAATPVLDGVALPPRFVYVGGLWVHPSGRRRGWTALLIALLLFQIEETVPVLFAVSETDYHRVFERIPGIRHHRTTRSDTGDTTVVVWFPSIGVRDVYTRHLLGQASTAEVGDLTVAAELLTPLRRVRLPNRL